MENSYLYLAVFLYLILFLFITISFKKNSNLKNDFDFYRNKINPNLFNILITATSFSGGIMIVFPSIIFRDGFQASFICFVAIIIPLTGILFFKKQWLLAQKFNYTSPVEMYYDYFKCNTIKLIIILITLFFSVFFLSIQFLSVSKLLIFISNYNWQLNYIVLFIGIILLLNIFFGGLKSIALTSVLNLFLIWFGIILLGLSLFYLIGGFEEFKTTLSKLALLEKTRWNTTPIQNYSSLFAVPDIIQLTKGIPKEVPVGGIWTATMTFSFIITFMGVQASPIFSMLSISAKNYYQFEKKQIILSSIIMGIALFIFIIFISISSNLIGSNFFLNELGSTKFNYLPESLSKFNEESLILNLIKLFKKHSIIIFGLLSMSFVAAIISSGSIFILCGSSMIVNSYFIKDKNFNDKKIILIKIFSFIIAVIAVLTAIFFKKISLILVGLSVALSFQLIVPLMAICFFKKLTSSGIRFGLIFGIIITLMTDELGQMFFGEYIPWGKWPFTIYSGFWGIMANFSVAILISLLKEKNFYSKNKEKIHTFYLQNKKYDNSQKLNLYFSIFIFVIWFFFSIGPGIFIGNDIFGKPNDSTTWLFSLPSIWVWQIIFWVLGIFILLKFSNSLNSFLYEKKK